MSITKGQFSVGKLALHLLASVLQTCPTVTHPPSMTQPLRPSFCFCLNHFVCFQHFDLEYGGLDYSKLKVISCCMKVRKPHKT